MKAFAWVALFLLALGLPGAVVGSAWGGTGAGQAFPGGGVSGSSGGGVPAGCSVSGGTLRCPGFQATSNTNTFSIALSGTGGDNGICFQGSVGTTCAEGELDWVHSTTTMLLRHASIFEDNAQGTQVKMGSYLSRQASGSDAFSVSTNGARFHFGSGASDYASSDGTTVTFASPLAWSLATDKVPVGNAGSVATATSVPSCSAANSTLQYSTTSHAWSCSTTAAVTTFFADTRFGVYTADTNWLGGYVATHGTETTVAAGCTCEMYGTAGSGGTTGMAIQLWDVSGATAIATDSTNLPCNTAVRTPTKISFGAVSLTGGRQYVLRETTKGNCTTGPTDIACSCNLSP